MMDELEEQKRQEKLRRLLELKNELVVDLEDARRRRDAFDRFNKEEDISITIKKSYDDNTRFTNLPKHIISKVIIEIIEFKEERLAKVKEEIATEINHLAEGDKQ